MIIRRLVKAGQASHTISLPKEWLEKNALKKGDVLYISELSDRELLITPESKVEQPSPQKELTISVDGKSLSTIQREITAAYINNYGTIVLSGESIPSLTNDLRKILHDFVALEVADQTSKQIVAKDLLNPKEISIDKTLRRMDMLVRSMLQDCLASIDDPKLAQNVVIRDYEVNRAYFLLLRLLKSALASKKTADSFNLTSTQILDYWSLTMNLESFADAVKQLVGYFGKEKKKERVKKVFELVQKAYLDAVKAYFTKNKKLADEVALQRESLLEQASGLSPGLSELLKTMVTLANSIARQVIDKE